MEKILFLIVLFITTIGVNAQKVDFTDGCKIYIVRHAEKESGEDPLLTEDGKKRSGDLMRALKNKNVKRIYITNYQRSGMTADSMRIQLGIDTVHYLADKTGKDLLKKIKVHHDTADVILVIGHSNTIPSLISALGVEGFSKSDIPEDEFDNLYTIEHTSTSRGDIVSMGSEKYGTRPRTPASMKNQ